MRSPLWSKIIGVVIGVLLGASAVYAAGMVYDYNAQVPSVLTVNVTAAGDVTHSPGLAVSPTSIDFGALPPGAWSEVKCVEVSSISDPAEGIPEFVIRAIDCPSDITVLVSDIPDGEWKDISAGCVVRLQGGTSERYYFKVKPYTEATPGSRNFTIDIREP